MRVIQFCKVDMIRCRSQLRFLLLFAILAFLVSTGTSSGSFFGVAYMIFGAVIFSGQPFNMEQMAESGYIDMLPGSKFDRVAGRFLYSLVLLIYAIVVGILIVVVMHVTKGASMEGYESIFVGVAAAGLLICSLQNICFYAIGKGKSQQLMGIIRMVPGFVTFFAGLSIVEELQGNENQYRLEWVMAHSNELLIGAVMVAVIVFIAGILISTALIQKRDFN